jgi:hypothetical protein
MAQGLYKSIIALNAGILFFSIFYKQIHAAIASLCVITQEYSLSTFLGLIIASSVIKWGVYIIDLEFYLKC